MIFCFLQHHCRNCGEIFCNACSDNTMSLPSSAKPVRVCDDCHVFLVGRYSVVQWTEVWPHRGFNYFFDFQCSSRISHMYIVVQNARMTVCDLCRSLVYISITKSFLLFSPVFVWYFHEAVKQEYWPIYTEIWLVYTTYIFKYGDIYRGEFISYSCIAHS
jgi:hypothetical protein